MNKHHIIPKSRAEEGFYVHTKNNIILLDEKLHSNFHRLFQNLTPQEQLDLLFFINKQVLSREIRDVVREIIQLDHEDFYGDQFLI